jgi:2-amino-4-hydroxy-6-hydroxymethyldihydropteridine diphosphokinase
LSKACLSSLAHNVPHTYAIALGSNRPHGHYGTPEQVLRAAVRALGSLGEVERVSRIHRTAALGPAGRGFANAAAILATDLGPEALLAALKVIERRFGRRPGRRWGPRVLDLDIILWSGGRFAGRGLEVPHPHFRDRDFVLAPASEIIAGWRDPATGLSIRHLRVRLGRHRRSR